MENENERTNRIVSGVVPIIQDMADDINNNRKTIAANIKDAQPSMERYQEIIDTYKRNRDEAKSAINDGNKTPIGIVQSIKSNMAAAQEQEYQDAIHER